MFPQKATHTKNAHETACRTHLVRPLLVVVAVRGALARERARRHGLQAKELGVRDAAHVPQLAEDLAALGVHGVGDGPPAGDLRGRVDARRARPTMRLSVEGAVGMWRHGKTRW